MPKIVDHARRRDEIALVACRVVAAHGFDRASMVRIAREAGYTTGMLAHYFEALPIDAHRHIECAFWITFWGQVTADKRLKRINAWVHREYLRLFERCLDVSWQEWQQWPAATREQLLRSLVTFINGLTASAVANPGDWPAQKQIAQLRLQIELLYAWALSAAGTARAAGA